MKTEQVKDQFKNLKEDLGRKNAVIVREILSKDEKIR